MLCVLGRPSTPTTGKEAFIRGHTYSIKTDFGAQYQGRKKYVF
jgi:hypothetical protein